MPKQPFKTFKGLTDEIRQEVWPGTSAGTSNEAENLIQAHNAHFVEGIAEIQRECEGLRHLQSNVISFNKTFFKDGMTVVSLPNGVVTRIYTVDENWVQPVYFVETDLTMVQVAGLGSRKSVLKHLDDDRKLPLGFVHSDEKFDRKTGRARGGFWAKDLHTRNICISPWLDSEETLIVEWSGVKNGSEWSDQDPVPDWPDFKKVLKLYLQWAHERDFGDRMQASALRNANYSGTLDMALADLILWDREISRVHSEQGEVIARQHLHGFAIGFGFNPSDPTADVPAKEQPCSSVRPPGSPMQPGDPGFDIQAIGITLKDSTRQVYEGSASDPNAVALKPDRTGQAAIYIQAPSVTIYNMWVWDVPTQVWIQVIQP